MLLSRLYKQHFATEPIKIDGEVHGPQTAAHLSTLATRSGAITRVPNGRSQPFWGDDAMKVFVIAAVAAAFVVPSNALAKQSNEIVVAVPSVAEWSDAVGEKLDRHLRVMRPAFLPDGYVTVRFRCSDNGKPREVRVSGDSGNLDLAFLGQMAVRRLSNMHPLPAGVGPNQVFEAQIIAASSHYGYERQLAKLRADQVARNTNNVQERVIALAPNVAGANKAS